MKRQDCARRTDSELHLSMFHNNKYRNWETLGRITPQPLMTTLSKYTSEGETEVQK